MADKNHLKILQEGPAVWNQWRMCNPQLSPSLNGADLQNFNLSKYRLIGVELIRADLRGANLSGACLQNSILKECNLRAAHLVGTDLSQANLINSDLSGAMLNEAYLHRADLSGCRLERTHLLQADLSGANLSHSVLDKSFLHHADFTSANLDSCRMNEANARMTRFDWASFVNADLRFASFVEASFTQANFLNAFFGGTSFSDVNLSDAINLGSAGHEWPSSIGIDTLIKSDGKISEEFLSGCGVPQGLFTYIMSAVEEPLQIDSCFISFNECDRNFAEQLYARMKRADLRVWFAPKDMRGGEKILEQIERAIQLHERILIVLSKTSMQSEWVMTEIRKARKEQFKSGTRKLFPIRLVDMETMKDWEYVDSDSGKDLAAEMREYYIPDFSNWHDGNSFEQEFSKLLNALRGVRSAEASEAVKIAI